jgi:hypothetical protein
MPGLCEETGMTGESDKSALEGLEEDFKKACDQLRAGAECDGTRLSRNDCQILIMRLKTSVDISPMVTMLHELIGKTLAVWKEKT